MQGCTPGPSGRALCSAGSGQICTRSGPREGKHKPAGRRAQPVTRRGRGDRARYARKNTQNLLQTKNFPPNLHKIAVQCSNMCISIQNLQKIPGRLAANEKRLFSSNPIKINCFRQNPMKFNCFRPITHQIRRLVLEK